MQYSQHHFNDNKTLFYAWFEAMHTRVDIVMYVEAGKIDLAEIAYEMEREIAKYNSIANRFDATSEISIVNKNAFGNKISISPELNEILTQCARYNIDTLGLFDITINSQNGDTDNTSFVHLAHNAVEFLKSGIKLDLSGFIKGYVLEKIIDIVDKNQVSNALINIGNSSVYAKGNHPHGKGWKVKVAATALECVLCNQCLTTSGNDEATQHPIVNPRNRFEAKTKKTVSIITSHAAMGEVLSKVAFLGTTIQKNEIFKKFSVTVLEN